MDSKSAKSNGHYAFLTKQRDEYIKNLTRIGTELSLLNDGNFDIHSFVKQFIPSRDKVKNEVIKEFIGSQTSSPQRQSKSSPDQGNSVDSQLMEAIQAEFKKYENEFRDTLKISEEDSDVASFVEVEVPEKVSRKKRDKKSQSSPVGDCDVNDIFIDQVINHGELSKIFVQKSRVDVVRSKTNKPCFEDANLETIYIYRSKKC